MVAWGLEKSLMHPTSVSYGVGGVDAIVVECEYWRML